MHVQQVAKEYRLSQWVQIIQERQASGQKVIDFCNEKGISKHAYFYWQRKIREAACSELEKIKDTNKNIPAGWIQLPPSTDQNPESITIEIKGCRINADFNSNPELLKRVCRVLREL